jgi:D-glycerate 3-kinase
MTHHNILPMADLVLDMAEHTSTHQSISNILRRLGKGESAANLNVTSIRCALERLEASTDSFWGAFEATTCVYQRQRLEVKCQLLQLIYPAFETKCRQLRMTAAPRLETLWRVYLPLAEWVVGQRRRFLGDVFVLGINGAQGSGKSTLCALLQVILEVGFSQRVVALSIDDFYLTRAERQHLAEQVHPLFITRGVPGTHDVTLAIKVLKSLKSAHHASSTPLPTFDKALDDRLPEKEGPIFQGRPDIVLFEGWCVGAQPEPEQRLARPINTLEIEEDVDGVWRRYVNQALGKQYAQLFGLLDALFLLKIPEFKAVYALRLEQEQQLAHALSERHPETSTRQAMSVRELQRFIMHFQRLTEYMLDEMPMRADLVLEIDEHRQFLKARRK